MKCYFPLFLLLLLYSCKEGNQVTPNPPEFIGTWAFESVALDVELKSGWEGHTLTFESITDSTGTYFLDDAVVDTIWNETGTWKLAKSSTTNFIREDGVEVSAKTDSEKLGLVFTLHGYGEPCVINEPCPLGIFSWKFNLIKLSEP